MFWEFYYTRFGEDHSKIIEIEVEGVKIPTQEVECFILALLRQQVKFKLLMCEGACVGYLMYHEVASAILWIRGLYIDSKLEGHGLVPPLVKSSLKRVKKVIFQTTKYNPPNRLLSQAELLELVDEDEFQKTWIMSFENL